MTKDTKMILGMVGIFISLGLSICSTRYLNLTATPPLVNLTLSQAGCEYLSQSGISGEVHNGICTIKVRYRQFHWGGGGIIEQIGLSGIEISGGQVVAINQIDDGSNEPWSDEHRKAVAYLISSFLLALFFLCMLARSARTTEKNDPDKR
jgi:hypothetical protein